ncbi:MAG: DUF58 domain-containing protein [Prochlorotrichaceae cyanobacterium]
MQSWGYALLSAGYPLQQFLMRRLTPQGAVAVAALLIAGAAGMDTRQTLAYQVFALLLGMFGIAFFFIWRFPCHLKIERLLPRFGTVGQPTQYRILIANQSNRPLTGLQLFEVFADPRPSFEELQTAIYEADPTRQLPRWRQLFSSSIGQVGPEQWQKLLERKKAARVRVLQFPPLPPKGRGEVIVELTPEYRGRVQFRGVVIGRPDPLGLLNACRFIPLPQTLWLLPSRYPILGISLEGARRYQSGGVSLASTVGDTEEFRSLREYRPGDPLRKIHWKSWAKVDKPIVKEEQDEFFVRHALILDTFQPQTYSDKLEAAVSIAASLACSFHTEDALLDLMFVGTEAYCFTSGRSLGHTEQMLQILASVTPCLDKSFDYLTPVVLSRSHLLSGCICVFLTWDAARAELVQYLQSLQLPLMIFVLQDEQHPLDFEGIPLNLESTKLRVISSDRLAESLLQVE